MQLVHRKFFIRPKLGYQMNFSAKSAMASVYRDLESMRPQLFRLASEANENNDELMGVLRLTDEVNRVINVVKDKYPDVVELSK